MSRGLQRALYSVSEVLSLQPSVLTPLVRVRLNVPMSKDIARVVLLDTSGLDLLETPLWQIDVSSSEVAVQISMLESECRGQCTDLGIVVRSRIIDNLDSPMILGITNCHVAIARDLVVRLCYWSSDLMRV